MPRRGENIYKRKDGRWEGRILCGHKEERKPVYAYVYGHSYREVKSEIESCRILNTRSIQSARWAKFSEIAQSWLATKRSRVKESTFIHYRNMVDTHILPALGAYPVCELDDVGVSDYIDTLLHHGRLHGSGGLSSKTVSDILILLKAILRYAASCGCELRVHTEMLVVKKRNREMRVLTPQEQNQLVTALESSTDRRSIGVLLSLYTGLRLGEICALRWNGIDLDSQTIHVQETMLRMKNIGDDGTKTKIVITDPKSECSIRDIPIPQFLIPTLRESQSSGNSFLLTGQVERFVEPRSMEYFFHRCLVQCNISHANYHALRHSFATRCVEAGFDIKSLSEILGHSSVSITLNRYVHSSFDQKRRNMGKLTRMVE